MYGLHPKRGEKRKAPESKSGGAKRARPSPGDEKDSKESKSSPPLSPEDKGVLDELSQLKEGAQLPDANFLPAQYLSHTRKKDTERAFVPKLDSRTGKFTHQGTLYEIGKESKSHKLDFLDLTGKDKTNENSPIPGVAHPSSVRSHLHEERKDDLYTDPDEKEVAMCMAHGRSVLFRDMHADHLESVQSIVNWLAELTKKLNDSDNPDQIIEQGNLQDFFIKMDGKYYGTLYLHRLYYNDIGNIWLICGACNGQKNAKDTLAWLESNWTFGPAFAAYLKEKGINADTLARLPPGEGGLATIATRWFYKTHAVYLDLYKMLDTDVLYPIVEIYKQSLAAEQKADMAQAEKLQLEMIFRTHLAKAIMEMPLEQAMDQLQKQGYSIEHVMNLVASTQVAMQAGTSKFLAKKLADMDEDPDLDQDDAIAHGAVVDEDLAALSAFDEYKRGVPASEGSAKLQRQEAKSGRSWDASFSLDQDDEPGPGKEAKRGGWATAVDLTQTDDVESGDEAELGGSWATAHDLTQADEAGPGHEAKIGGSWGSAVDLTQDDGDATMTPVAPEGKDSKESPIDLTGDDEPEGVIAGSYSQMGKLFSAAGPAPAAVRASEAKKAKIAVDSEDRAEEHVSRVPRSPIAKPRASEISPGKSSGGLRGLGGTAADLDEIAPRIRPKGRP